jgi:RNA polymerase-binding protein DksA
MATKAKKSKTGKAKAAAKAVPQKKTPAARRPAAKVAARKTRPAAKPAAAPRRPKRAVPAPKTPKTAKAPTGRAAKVREVAPEVPKDKAMGKKDQEFFRKLLLNLRDRIVDEISFLAGENLNHSQREASGDLSNYGMHMADQGTDNFDREFALSLVSNEQEVLYEIDDALHRIDGGTYGLCEATGKQIEFERLKVLPYARLCREAQELSEKNRKRFRPFATTPSQVPASSQED